tara:strand:- start:2651 stop:2824 length:174 start_codon:yes stop_codon:yes gene_type:complete
LEIFLRQFREFFVLPKSFGNANRTSDYLKNQADDIWMPFLYRFIDFNIAREFFLRIA